MQARKRRRFLSQNEGRANAILSAVAACHGVTVHPHVKLTHVVSERPKGITEAQWEYATRAEFDFVVVDTDSGEVDFAIELDDLSHLTPDGQRRDKLKDAVCGASGLELLRVEFTSAAPRGNNAEHVGVLDTWRQGRRLVDYLIEARSYMRAFYQAQDDGSVPLDEFGDFRNTIERDETGRLRFVNDLSNDARLRALEAKKAGNAAQGVIHGTSWSWASGFSEGWAWLLVRSDLLLFQRTSVRGYRFDCGFGPSELAEDIAAAAIGDQLSALDRGEAVLTRASDVQLRVEAVQMLKHELATESDRSTIDHLSFVARS